MVYSAPTPEQLAQQQMEAARQRAADIKYQAEHPDTFNPLLFDIAQGKNDVQTVAIRSKITTKQGKKYFEYTGTSDNPQRSGNYSEGSTLIQGNIDNYAKIAIENTKNYLLAGDEDIIIMDGKVVHQSNLTPEQLNIAYDVQRDRSKYEANVIKYKAQRQEELKRGMLESPSAKWASTDAYSTAFQEQYGIKPPASQLSSIITPISSQQLELKRKQLQSGAASWESPDFFVNEVQKMERRGAPVNVDLNKTMFYGIEGAPGYRTSETENNKRLAAINKQIKVPDTYFKTNMNLTQYPNTPIDYGSSDKVRSETELKGLPLNIMAAGTGIDQTIHDLPLPGIIKGVGRGAVMLGTGMVATGAAVAVTIPITIERIKKGTFIDSMKQLPGATIKEAENSVASAVNAVVQTPDIGEKIGLAGTLIGVTAYGAGIRLPKVKGTVSSFIADETARVGVATRIKTNIKPIKTIKDLGSSELATTGKTSVDKSIKSTSTKSIWDAEAKQIKTNPASSSISRIKKSSVLSEYQRNQIKQAELKKLAIELIANKPRAEISRSEWIEADARLNAWIANENLKYGGQQAKAPTYKQLATPSYDVNIEAYPIRATPITSSLNIPKTTTSQFRMPLIIPVRIPTTNLNIASKRAIAVNPSTNLKFYTPTSFKPVVKTSQNLRYALQPVIATAISTKYQTIVSNNLMTRFAKTTKTQIFIEKATKIKQPKMDEIKIPKIPQLSDQFVNKKHRKARKSSAWQVKNPFITLKDI